MLPQGDTDDIYRRWLASGMATVYSTCTFPIRVKSTYTIVEHMVILSIIEPYRQLVTDLMDISDPTNDTQDYPEICVKWPSKLGGEESRCLNAENLLPTLRILKESPGEHYLFVQRAEDP